MGSRPCRSAPYFCPENAAFILFTRSLVFFFAAITCDGSLSSPEAARLGDPAVNRLNKRMIAQHRSQRLEDCISAATINRDIYRLSGMFSTLIKLEEFRKDNPCKGLEPLKEAPPAMAYIAKSEISKLLDTLTGDDRRVALLCLSTGARWGEGSTLRGEQVNHGRVTFLKTKNGKKRTVPISAELEKEIKTSDTGPLFKVDYKNFCERLRQVKPDLPRGQATHVLRHTFTSWFMMNGGTLLRYSKFWGTPAYNRRWFMLTLHLITCNTQ